MHQILIVINWSVYWVLSIVKASWKIVKVVLEGVIQASVCETVMKANAIDCRERYLPELSGEFLDAWIKGRLHMGIRYKCARETVMWYGNDFWIFLHWRT